MFLELHGECLSELFDEDGLFLNCRVLLGDLVAVVIGMGGTRGILFGRGNPRGDLSLAVDEGRRVVGMVGCVIGRVGVVLIGHSDGDVDLPSSVLLMSLWLLLVEGGLLLNFPSVYEASTGISHPQSL